MNDSNKVYILEYLIPYEGSEIFGVFKSRQLAKKYKNKFSNYIQYDLVILEYELDVLSELAFDYIEPMVKEKFNS